MKFIGRHEELGKLYQLTNTKTAKLVVLTGRRRIGKSSLIYQFSKKFKRFYEFQGLAPRKEINNALQLKNFAEQLKIQFEGTEPRLSNWNEAFLQLSKEIGNKPALVFLDELSWMGGYDPDFVGKLKVAWDTLFHKIPGLIIILCGSVSAWIEDNILNQADFVGRISLTIRLKELEIKNTINFWDSSEKTSLQERLAYVSVCGGIPKYLEEFDPKQTATQNIKRLCFTKGGYLFEDFEKIFSDIFGKRSASYKKILKTIVNRHLTPGEITKKLNLSPGGDLAGYLRDLELSGFISRDYFYKPGGVKSKLSKLRISDNYLRFYLKYIEPYREQINSGIYKFTTLDSLLSWETIRGLQFENLILNRVPELLAKLDISNERILSAGPFFQNNTYKTKACQIDLLIEVQGRNFYLCEIKWQKVIRAKVISEVREKVKLIKLPKYSSRRPVLIYFGELDECIRESEFFDKIVSMEEWMEGLEENGVGL